MPDRDIDDDRDPPRRPRRWDDADSDPPREKRGNSTLYIVLGVVGGVVLVVCGGGVALTLFATGNVREAAARAQTQNHLKQIGLALHNHESVNGPLAVPFARDPGAAAEGAPAGAGGVNKAMSFRVELLPYLEQAALYGTIDRSQPWNAPRNAGPCSTPVSSFQTVVDTQAPKHHTPFRAFVGGEALFSADGKPVPLATIKDGMSNTLFLIEAAETVPWAEPRELPYSKTAPLPPFGGAGRRGPMVLMADGSVRVLSKAVPEATLRAAIEPGDGVAIDFDSMK